MAFAGAHWSLEGPDTETWMVVRPCDAFRVLESPAVQVLPPGVMALIDAVQSAVSAVGQPPEATLPFLHRALECLSPGEPLDLGAIGMLLATRGVDQPTVDDMLLFVEDQAGSFPVRLPAPLTVLHPVEREERVEAFGRRLAMALLVSAGSTAQVAERASRDAVTSYERVSRDASAPLPDVGRVVLDREACLERLRSECAYSRRHGAFLSLVLFRFHHLPQVEALFGPGAGQRVLQEALATVHETLRAEDVIGQLEPETLVAVLRGSAPMEVRGVKDRLAKRLASREALWDGARLPVFPAVGFASLVIDECDTPTQLLAAAAAELR